MQEQLNDVLRNHVSPHICQRLYDWGLKIPSKYFWKATATDCQLGSYAFDKDGYYQEGDEAIHALGHKPLFVVPAWTVAELEPHVPDFYIERINGEYELHADANYPKLKIICAKRIPDCFGMLVEQMLIHRIINPKLKI